ncbi:MAG: lytic murein transglycosylase B [Gammaproteobacteria bacterium]|nr:MAG: lytic murein transglycosylase B [Gammaproteobacteria bacterium]
MRPLWILLLLSCLGTPAVTAAPAPGDVPDHFPETVLSDFARRVARERHLPEDWVRKVLAQAHPQPRILQAMARPAEALPWYRYRPIFVNPSRIDAGIAFWDAHARLLDRIARTYDVDIPYVVAILGVETRYGRHTGRFRVLDALATLAFDYPPRSRYFRHELAEFLSLVHEESLDPLRLKGSYAGAMGGGQFMPSSYRTYAVDFDGDGVRDLWDSPADILASVANYLHAYGWQAGGPVAAPARVQDPAAKPVLEEAGLPPRLPLGSLLQRGVHVEARIPEREPAALLALEDDGGTEYWVVFHNFHVITRYNRSPLYAMAVHQLAQAIRAGREHARLDDQ